MQQHKQMYKKTVGADKDKRGEMLKGVRLNRRFDLQMEYRRNLE